MFASVAMVCAVAQIWPGLRRRRPALHRRVGRVYVCTAIPAAVCAMVIGAATPFGPILAVSNVLLASLWLWFTVNGYLAGRYRRFAAHRRHMVLSGTLALSIITNRIWTPILFITLHPLQDSAFGGNEEHYLWVRRGHRRLARLDGPDRIVVYRWLTAQTGNAVVVKFSASAHIAGVISGRLGTTRRRTTRTRLGHGNRIQRQDRAGYP